MHPPINIPIWKKAPLLRLLLPLLAGILLQWYLSFSLFFIVLGIISFLVAYLVFYFLRHAFKYRLSWLQGISLQLIIVACACLLTWQKDSRRKENWFGNYYTSGSHLLLKLQEPVVEKANSFKAEAEVLAVIAGDTAYSSSGKILIYFSKNDTAAALDYGQQIIINQELQAIKSAGNPGSFNYKRYAAFQQIHYTVYLRPQNFIVTGKLEGNAFYKFIYAARAYVLQTIETYVGTDKNITAIAEAMLIGYKENLDRDLLQAYSNTGVVHIIAISGLHLGLIYLMLVFIFDRLPFIKKSVLIKTLLLIACLWLFAILTGASASVLRSAVMFTCVAIGKNFFKQASVYNSLAASAVILLGYNPYLLWDVGFQLSYLAVLGIVWLQPFIYRWVYFKYKALRYVWAMVSVTLAAQIAAFPICMFYFHQFPNMFLFTNLFTVPLAELLLITEIALVAFSWNSFLAGLLGKLVGFIIYIMNGIVNFFNNFSYSVTDNIYATKLSTFLLYALIISICCWFIYRSKKWRMAGLVFSVLFIGFYVQAYFQLQQQQKIIVYNVSKYSAIDFIQKDKYFFIGDSILLEDGLLQNFHLKPSRIAMQLQPLPANLPGIKNNGPFWQIQSKILMLANDNLVNYETPQSFKVDYLILSKNTKINLPEIARKYRPSQVIIDASNSLWKIAQWKKQCEELHLQSFSVSTEGAFVVNLP